MCEQGCRNINMHWNFSIKLYSDGWGPNESYFKRLVKDLTLVKDIVFFSEIIEFYFIVVWLFK